MRLVKKPGISLGFFTFKAGLHYIFKFTRIGFTCFRAGQRAAGTIAKTSRRHIIINRLKNIETTENSADLGRNVGYQSGQETAKDYWNILLQDSYLAFESKFLRRFFDLR
jgi:hypothetical protein